MSEAGAENGAAAGAAAGVVFGVPDGVRRIFPSQPDATRIVLVRHGEAVCNVNGVVGGARGCAGLTALGREQVATVADRLTVTGELRGTQALYSSTLPRAIETAELLRPFLGDGRLTITQDRALRELDPGQADALTWQQVIEQFGVPEWDTDPSCPIAPGGESWSGFVARVAGALRAVVERHPGQLVVAAVHAGVIEAAMISFLQIPAEAHGRGWARVLHASLTEWEWVPGEARWVLLRFNDACGVPGPVPVRVDSTD